MFYVARRYINKGEFLKAVKALEEGSLDWAESSDRTIFVFWEKLDSGFMWCFENKITGETEVICKATF